MGLFDGYENISPSGESGNPPPQGDHTVTITRCEAPQNLRCGEAYIVHYTIDASTSQEAQIGGEYSNFQGFQAQPEAARAAMLSLMIALAGQKRDTPGAEQVKRAIGQIMRAGASASNPFAGLKVHVRAGLRQGKKIDPATGQLKSYIRQDFFPLNGCEGQIAIMLAAAGAVQAAPPPAAFPGPYAPPTFTAPAPPLGTYHAPAFAPPVAAAPPAGFAPPATIPTPPGYPAPPPGFAYGPSGQFVKL